MVRAVQSAGFACYYCAFDPDDAWAYSDVREHVDVAQWELPFVFSEDRVYVCAGSIYFLGRFYDQFPECWSS